MQIATREILWNLNSPLNIFMLYALLLVTIGITAAGIYSRCELWAGGRSEPQFKTNWLARIWKVTLWAFFQRGVVREKKAGVFHTLIYVGFIILLITTTSVLIHHDFGIKIYQGNFYLLLTILSDVLGFGVLVGCLFAAHRRYLTADDKVHNRFADSLLLNLLALLILQGFVLEGLRIHATDDPWASYSIVGLAFAKLFWPLSYQASVKIHFFTWWFHTLTVYAFIALIPYTKMFHVISSSLNLFLKKWFTPKGALAYPGDLEKLIEQGDEFTIGLGSISDYSWKGLLDLDACTSCGRCQEACPAYITGTPLSPKWLILDTRNHMLALHSKGELTESKLPQPLVRGDQFLLQSLLINGSGLTQGTEDSFHYKDNGSFRAANPRVQKAALDIGRNKEDLIAGTVMEKDVFWSCVTCMACVEACPVGINHVDQIIGNRRNMVLMQGEVPTEAQATLRALETRNNPFAAPEERIKWTEGLDIRILKEGDEVDYLYWVGCVSAFDPRKQKIAKSLVKIMQSAGLSFGILGNAEGCSGDPARRLGEENLFQALAKNNIALLKTLKFRTIVANCPHCFNTLKNEYPQLGNLSDGEQPEIIHHSVLLRQLLEAGKIKLHNSDNAKSFTFHDPCYLGRYNDEYDAPRDTLKKVSSLKIIEMEKSRNKGMCCGAGGGHFWMDLKLGERINSLRTDQAAATGAGNIATACPFCMQMLEDGVKLTNRESSLNVRDLAEVIAENMA